MKYKRVAFLIPVGIIICLAAVFLVPVSFLHVIPSVESPLLVSPSVPMFQRGDCFNFNEEDEVWDVHPDGIIERVGRAKYLILFRESADQRDGTKVASDMSIAVFDANHHKVDCPASWVSHGHK